MGIGKYTNGRKQLHAFAFRSTTEIDPEQCVCSSLTKQGWPEVNKFEFVDTDVAIEKLHHVQSDLLKEHIKHRI